MSYQITLFLSTLLIAGVQCIRLKNNNRPQVPPFAVKGKQAVLGCDFDLEGAQLYSVKWYKNGYEFYRYHPGRKATIYARPGVQVVPSMSNSTQVTLTALSRDSTGRYRCEVSTEGPTFATDSGIGDMIVVVLPERGPEIQGGLSHYEPGDEVNLNCTSHDSKPAADLVWYINGQIANDERLINYPIRNTSRDLHTSILGIRFTLSADDISDSGDIKLKCTANIETIYWKSNEKSAESLKQKRGAFSSKHSSYSSSTSMAENGFQSGLSAMFSNSANIATSQYFPIFHLYTLISEIIIALLLYL